jgi:hypothetical protein
MSWRAHLVLKVGVLDSKNCEGNVKLKYMDSHFHGASLIQISAMLSGELKCITYNHVRET